MKSYNAVQVSYELVNVDVWNKVKTTRILTDYETVVGDIIEYHSKLNKADLFSYVQHYNVSYAIVERALRSLVDYGLVTEYTQQALIKQQIKGTLHIDPDTDTVSFFPMNDYWLTASNKSLVNVKVDFDSFDFSDTNYINGAEIKQESRVVTTQLEDKKLPPPPTKEVDQVTAQEIKLAKQVNDLRDRLAKREQELFATNARLTDALTNFKRDTAWTLRQTKGFTQDDRDAIAKVIASCRD